MTSRDWCKTKDMQLYQKRVIEFFNPDVDDVYILVGPESSMNIWTMWQRAKKNEEALKKKGVKKITGKMVADKDMEGIADLYLQFQKTTRNMGISIKSKLEKKKNEFKKRKKEWDDEPNHKEEEKPYPPRVYLIIPVNVGLSYFHNLYGGDYTEMKTDEGNHWIETILDVTTKKVMISDSLADEKVRKVWCNALKNWLFSKCFIEHISDPSVMPEKKDDKNYKGEAFRYPMQVKSLCGYYCNFVVREFVRGEVEELSEVYDILTGKRRGIKCPDDHIDKFADRCDAVIERGFKIKKT